MEENQLELTKPCTIPPHETPSHRLAEHSARYLSDTELLSLILKGSIGTERSLEASRRLLAACGSLRKLAALTLRELQKFAGIGTVGACAIHAAMELTVRIQRAADTANRIVLTSPQDVADCTRSIFVNLQQEQFHVLLLDTKHGLIRNVMATRGLLDRSQVHAREVFREAIRDSCSRVILLHNHPSGDPTPSAQDISCTKNLAAAGKIIGIEVLDHVVIGRLAASRSRDWLSFREEGLM